jgi:uncharacterized membrane protein YGL010W
MLTIDVKSYWSLMVLKTLCEWAYSYFLLVESLNSLGYFRNFVSHKYYNKRSPKLLQSIISNARKIVI